MAEKKRGSYTPDFRIKAADLAIASEVRIGDIAKTLNVLPNTLSNWVAKRKKQLKSSSLSAVASLDKNGQLPLRGKRQADPSSSQAEIERLRREVRRLQQERKVIKEAIILLTT